MDHVHHLLPLIIVWNALKTSRKVLGADMPSPETAQQMEERTEKVMSEGLDSVERLLARGEASMKNAMVEYARDAVRRCQ
jgi:hypothetical protein